MSMFDSIINEGNEKYHLGDKAGSLLSSLLGLISDQTRGGFNGFLERFRTAGLGDTVDSWIGSGGNRVISNEQVESALGTETTTEMARQAGLDHETTKTALGAMIPGVVDRLTPEGVIPTEDDLLSRLGGYLSGVGNATVSTTGVMASDTVDRFGSATAEHIARHDADDLMPDANDDSPLKWLLPLILLGILMVLGYSFCGGRAENPPAPTPAPNANANRPANAARANTANSNSTARAVDSSVTIKAENGKYIVTGAVPDEATKKQIVDALTAQYGAGNVDFSGLTVNASARPLATNWWNSFAALLPSLKDWKTGELSFVGNAVTAASGLPQAAITQLKSLFGTGWRLPASIAGEESAARRANEEAERRLSAASGINEVVEILNTSIINFATKSAAIPANTEALMAKTAEVLKAQPAGTIIEIGGHTDSDGDDQANQKLSEERANSVRNDLIKRGVSAEMLRAKGYGETKSIAPNDTPDNKFKNRRIEYAVASGTGGLTTETHSTNSNANANHK